MNADAAWAARQKESGRGGFLVTRGRRRSSTREGDGERRRPGEAGAVVFDDLTEPRARRVALARTPTASWSCTRARAAPRQWCGPNPKARCGVLDGTRIERLGFVEPASVVVHGREVDQDRIPFFEAHPSVLERLVQPAA